jgi:nitrate reductase cytochrome c-type subunit
MLTRTATLAGVLTIAGASLLLAGFASSQPSTVGSDAASPAQQGPGESLIRVLVTPVPAHEMPKRRFDRVVNRDAACAHSLATRRQNRAFEGAPPTIPHDITSFTRSKTCLDCHGEGFALGDRIARAMPHPFMASCEQCHVTQQPAMAAASESIADTLAPPLPTSTFEGLLRSGPAQRDWAEAPPVIPHSLLMRTDCLSCHGEYGYDGLRTSHPNRSNCIQCHLTWR